MTRSDFDPHSASREIMEIIAGADAPKVIGTLTGIIRAILEMTPEPERGAFTERVVKLIREGRVQEVLQ